MATRYSPELKSQVALEVIEHNKSAAEVARAYDVHPNTVRNWVQTFRDNAAAVFAQDGEVNDLEQDVRELEQLVGKKEREIAVLKNFLGQPTTPRRSK
jgi:transposase-like protein